MSTTTVPPANRPTTARGTGLEPHRGGWFVHRRHRDRRDLDDPYRRSADYSSVRRLSSTRPGGGRCSPIRSEAGQWTLENYRLALDTGGFASAFLNSLAVRSVHCDPDHDAAFAAYAFSWMDFRGRYVMFIAVVGPLVVPLQMALIPILRLYNEGAIVGVLRVPRS